MTVAASLFTQDPNTKARKSAESRFRIYGVVAIAVIARYRNELIAAFEAGIEALRMARGG